MFEFNDCNVCINCEIIYSSDNNNPKYLAWQYYELKICCDENGNWDWGHSNCSGGGPAMKNGKFKTKDDAVEDGIAYLKKVAVKSINGVTDVNNSVKNQEQANMFLEWEAKRTQLTLF